MRSRVLNLVLLTMLLTLRDYRIEASTPTLDERNLARNFFDNALVRLMHQRRLFIDGFSNSTEALRESFDLDDSTGEGRGKRKKLKKMNQTLMAIAMAYTLKFIFLIPSFIGTLVLLKFTAALAGFFYALFAAVLGMDHHQHHHY